MSKQQFYIAIEGNIGAGKSTILSLLNERNPDKFEIIQEPLEDWERNNILEDYYKEPKKFAFTFQQLVLKAFELTEESKKSNKILIRERSPFSSYYIFTAIQYGHSHITEEELNQLKHQVEKVVKDNNPFNLIIYLSAPVEIVKGRIKERNRKGEERIPTSYLEQLEELHDQLFVTLAKEFSIPVERIETRENAEKVVEQLEEIINKVIREENREQRELLNLELEKKDNYVTWK